MLQEFEVVELRKLLESIGDDEERCAKAEQDLAHAQLTMSTAEQRLEKARARVKELTGAGKDEIDLMKRLAKISEQYGRTNL